MKRCPTGHPIPQPPPQMQISSVPETTCRVLDQALMIHLRVSGYRTPFECEIFHQIGVRGQVPAKQRFWISKAPSRCPCHRRIRDFWRRSNAERSSPLPPPLCLLLRLFCPAFQRTIPSYRVNFRCGVSAEAIYGCSSFPAQNAVVYHDVLGPWFQVLYGCVWLDWWRRRSRDGFRLWRAPGQSEKQCGEGKFKSPHRVLSFASRVLEWLLRWPTFSEMPIFR